MLHIDIRNNDDLRIAYELLGMLQSGERRAAYADKEAELKRRIRAFSRRPAPDRIVSDDGIDGYVELVETPERLDDWSKEDVAAWFEAKRVIEPYPSAYDCTGCAFTSWYKIIRRRGRWFVYHSVCFDV